MITNIIFRRSDSPITSDKPHYENVPFEVPSSWAWRKLEDFINDATDFVASGSFASLRENVKYYDEPEYAILVRTKDFQNGFTKGLVYTDRHGYEFLANSNLFGGELILPNIGASIGKVFIVPHLDIRMTLAPNSIMIKCFKDTHKKWLQYLFLSPFGQEQLRIISSSTAQGKFNKTDLRALQIPIPPFDEQERIISEVEFLSHFVEMIEYGQDKLQETIKQAKSKILDLAIHGKLVPQDPTDEPASELLKRINPKAEITCDNGHYQKLPEGWVITPMQTLCALVDGEKQNGIERINLDVKYLRGEREAKVLTSGKYTAANTLLILVDGENSGEVFRAPVDGYQGSTFKQLSIHEEMYTDYVLQVINLHRNTLRENKVGSAIPHLNKKLFKAINVPIPPYGEQKRIVNAINQTFTILDKIMENL